MNRQRQEVAGSLALTLMLVIGLLSIAVAGAIPVSAQSCEGWSGAWDPTSRGRMTVTQGGRDGREINGTFGNNNGRVTGTRSFAVNGVIFTGAWDEGSARGKFSLLMGKDCKSFTGTWGRGD